MAGRRVALKLSIAVSHLHRRCATLLQLHNFVFLLLIGAMTKTDSRTPCPPLGYSCECDLPEHRQIELVAEFHAYRIRPTRIAYRLGIDIALIDTLLAGEKEPALFEHLLRKYRKRRLNQRLTAAERKRGQAAYERRQRALSEFERQAADI